jgi:hypothetical protein
MKIYKAKGQGIFVKNILRIDTINSLDNDILLVKYKDGNEVIVDDYNIIADPKAKMEKVSDVISNLPKANDRITENIIINGIQIGDIIEIDGDAVIVDENILNMVKSFDTSNKLDILGDGSCVACYTLDGNANDLSGNHNGVWNGTEQYDQGVFGQAAKFDGNDGNGIVIPPILTQFNFSISVWIKTDDKTGGLNWYENTIIGFDKAGSGTKDFAIGNYSGKLKVRIETDKDYVFDTQKNIADNNWHHIFVNIYNNHCDVYLDNEFVDTYSYTSADDMEELNWGIGCILQDNNLYDSSVFNGLIDQVRIFNKTLTSEEIKKVYQESSKLIKKII